MSVSMLKNPLLDWQRGGQEKPTSIEGAMDAIRVYCAPQASYLYGLWRSPRSALYACDGREFLCVLVASPEHVGWVGKVAVRVTHFAGGSGRALQSFRNARSGSLIKWEPIEIELAGDVLTKRFPPWLPRNELLNGYVESYVRVGDPITSHRP